MERNRFWIFLGILVAFGITIDRMQNATPDTSKIKRIAARYDDIADAGMVAGADARAGRIAGLMRDSNEYPARVGVNVPASPVAAPATATNGTVKNAVAQNKTDKKKKDDKKKKRKKKKKTVEGKSADPNTPDVEEDSDTEDSDDAELSDGGVAGGGIVTPPGAGASDENEIPTTQREWEDIVLREPDFKATEKLVKFYLSNAVSAEIFYNVVRHMLDDSRPKMRQLGLVALGATPSPQSFAELAFFIHEESGVTPLKSQAQSYLQRYIDLAYMRHLASVMQMADAPVVNLEAIRIFRLAVDRHLQTARIRTPAELGETTQSSTEQGSQTPENGEGKQIVKKKSFDVTLYFRPFLSILERVQASYQNRELKQAAGNALNSLRDLLPVVAAQDPQPGSSTEEARQQETGTPTVSAAAPRSWR